MPLGMKRDDCLIPYSYVLDLRYKIRQLSYRTYSFKDKIIMSLENYMPLI